MDMTRDGKIGGMFWILSDGWDNRLVCPGY